MSESQSAKCGNDGDAEQADNRKEQRKVAFVHSESEVKKRLHLLCVDHNSKPAVRFRELLRRHMRTMLGDWRPVNPEDDSADSYVEALDLLFDQEYDPTHLGSEPLPAFVQDFPDYVLDAIHAAFPLALYHGFTTMARDKRSVDDLNLGHREINSPEDVVRAMSHSSSDVALFLASTNDGGEVADLPDLVHSMSRFFSEELGPEATNDKFWSYCIGAFKEVSGIGWGEYAGRTIGVNYPDQFVGIGIVPFAT